jgi:signal transduction histidine kinase
MVTASLPPALSAILQSARPAVVTLRLEPHPTAPRAARDLVSRTLLEWRLSQQIPDACLVVSELVTNAMIHAGTDIDLTLAEHRRSVRIAVRDHGHDLPVEQHGRSDEHGRGLGIVAELSNLWGVLPHADAGKVVWAVLDAAARPERVTRHRWPSPSANAERPFR